MGQLTEVQRKQVRDFLCAQGLSFQPLQDEMTDHVICDLEEKIRLGLSFDRAWQETLEQLPHNHFQTIQSHVMETIRNRSLLGQRLSILALALLLISTIFKVLHLQFSGELLLLSFASLGASLLTVSVTGISLHREKKGGLRILGVVTGVVLMLFGYSFKILHMPGADEVILVSVILLIISLLLNTLYVYQHASGKDNLLTFLHGKYTPGIERFFLFLLIPLTAYKGVLIFTGESGFVGNLVLLVVLFGAGLQFIALSWRAVEKDPGRGNILTLAATITCSVCIALPFLGSLFPFEGRVLVIVLFWMIACWLAYRLEDARKPIPAIVALLVPVVFVGWGLLKLGAIPSSHAVIYFNPVVLAALFFGLFIARRHGILRTYMILALSSYLFEYVM